MSIVSIDFIDLGTNKAFNIPNANYSSKAVSMTASINFNQSSVPDGVALEEDNKFEARSASPAFEDTGIYILEGQINLIFTEAFQ